MFPSGFWKASLLTRGDVREKHDTARRGGDGVLANDKIAIVVYWAERSDPSGGCVGDVEHRRRPLTKGEGKSDDMGMER
jgi:hypothetical protein